MHAFIARVPLPFYLRLEAEVKVDYDVLPILTKRAALEGKTFRVRPISVPAYVGRSGMPSPRSTLEIVLETKKLPQGLKAALSDGLLPEVLAVVNHVIDAYRSATRETRNGGFVTRLGLSDLQLFAELELDGVHLRDRWPEPSFNTFPLAPNRKGDFLACVADASMITPESIFLCEAMIALARGQYCQSFILGTVVIEVRLTEAIAANLTKLDAQGFRGRKLTLGNKLRLKPNDKAYAPKHFRHLGGFQGFWDDLKCINKTRNAILHHGHLTVTSEEAAAAIKAARYAIDELK